MSNIWNELSEESKKYIRKVFNEFEPISANDLVRMDLMTDLFGKENLNPKPPIKTWDDIEKYYPDLNRALNDLLDSLINYDVDATLGNKIAATFKIYHLVELGYGGIIADEEWDRISTPKFTIEGRIKELDCDITHGLRKLLAFHTREQRDKFLRNNEQLCKDYYMM